VTNEPGYVVVIPTLGRPSLQRGLDALAAAVTAARYFPVQLVLADDRRDTPAPLPVRMPAPLADRALVVALEGRGPAAARNAGWRAAAAAEWVVFLDDDVVVSADWASRLAVDLGSAEPRVGGVQGAVAVPWPSGRRPADSQRATLGLATARWITADMAYRRAALADAGGFDERFPRAYREDSDLALRVMDLGWTLRRGERRVSHPVRPPSAWASLRAQAGNADDAAMRHQHGPDWRRRAGASAGRRAIHAATCALGASAVLFGASAGLFGASAGLFGGARAVLGRGGGTTTASGPARAAAWTAAASAAGWAGLTGEFAARRILAGPRTWQESGAMIVTSVLIPPLAVWHWGAGAWRNRNAGPWPPRPAAVLFDRDGTLIHDVPYNGDPGKVTPMPGAAGAVAALRRAGLRVGVVSNQSGVGAGRITIDQVQAVNRRVDELAGPFDVWLVCPHGAGEGCGCRKPRPGLILAAAAELGVRAADCVVVGDIGADAAAARAAGARAILVPTAATRPGELAGVPCAPSLRAAVTAILRGRTPPSWRPAETAPAPAGQTTPAVPASPTGPAPAAGPAPPTDLTTPAGLSRSETRRNGTGIREPAGQ
jgi:HAD superfamily hydrolase (TIGR01662 family)